MIKDPKQLADSFVLGAAGVHLLGRDEPVPVGAIRWTDNPPRLHWYIMGGVDQTALRAVAYTHLVAPHQFGVEVWSGDKMVAYIAPWDEFESDLPPQAYIRAMVADRDQAITDPEKLQRFEEFWAANM